MMDAEPMHEYGLVQALRERLERELFTDAYRMCRSGTRCGDAELLPPAVSRSPAP